MVVKAFTMERRERRRFFLETKSLYKKSVRVAMIDALSDPVLEMLALSTVSIALLAGSYLVLNQTIFLDLGLFKLQLAVAADGDRGPALPLRDARRDLRPGPQAGQRPLADPARRGGGRPDLRPDGPPARGRRQARRRPACPGTGGRSSSTTSASATTAASRSSAGSSLTVRHGETIALVGPNGCGKSTLMNLLPRFWDVQSGAIRIDGHDIRDVQLRSLRGQIGMVIQETILFEDTIANNIAYGNRHASRDADRRGRQAGVRPPVHHRRCPTATTRSSASAASASPAASGSGSPWPAPCSATRPS